MFHVAFLDCSHVSAGLLARRGRIGMVCVTLCSISGMPFIKDLVEVHVDVCFIWRRVIVAGVV